MYDVPWSDRVPVDDCEQTMILGLPRRHWPDRDPDDRAVIEEARAALTLHDQPTLPILEAVLEGLQQLI